MYNDFTDHILLIHVLQRYNNLVSDSLITDKIANTTGKVNKKISKKFKKM